METKELIKETGATFTPDELADFLAEKIKFYAKNFQINPLLWIQRAEMDPCSDPLES